MPDYFAGLDVGQATDPSAIVIVRRTLFLKDGLPVRDTMETPLCSFAVSHVQRFPLKTPYEEVVDRVCNTLLSDPRYSASPLTLAVDATGIGRAVADSLTRRWPFRRLWPITITSGYGEARGSLEQHRASMRSTARRSCWCRRSWPRCKVAG